MDQILYYISIYALPILFAITLHEAAHGYVANYFGDSTAYLLGRVSLNPAKHIDPIGTVLLPGMLAVMGAPIFGWAKPVPVHFGALNNPKRDMVFVAAAGPLANLIMALLWTIWLKVIFSFGLESKVLTDMALVGVQINLLLMIFNLLPIPPLDGGRVLVGLLPTRLSIKLANIEPYGMYIVLLLVIVGGFKYILPPLLNPITRFLFTIVGL
ncbi:site-2 protease family protein [Taylorella equigenitalis]|uniref:Membrane metalloprotease n=3 Tax=Taylorella equigenitalis TaxID=29575 RepID=A0A654KGV6_TAYEM|nr:site-2 protease family protein [Taylorella equigenitalis]ADU91615.1 membrane metalloprotease [Taylorella equigenitalis MCE9]AFN35155.1 putative peptidase M50 [Taylorella equigenitalis ATCC 35865]ASY29851.1 site-2 protease family protein [Taylorella equigenitalis]ASY37155.1 site-2 protease family protein [Taylorella equigenitalis]ASY38599.1 site-2 protease family protein [Taylorella equigenitalis]